ncbi:MAG: ABC transporter substrate-binding protein [Calditrichaeota bacterium]|nr:ABC transporter substrate-binding protein [Calditrichota bacterium]
MRKIVPLTIGLTLLIFCLLPAQTSFEITEAYGDQLIIGMLGNPAMELNPFEIDTPEQRDVISLLFGGGLIQRPDKMVAPPTLIDRFVFTSGPKANKVWRMVLKRNIIFHDGTDVRNTDVKFTFEFLKKFGGHILNRRLNFQNIKTVRTVGDLEIIFELYVPDADFNRKLNDVPIISQRYYGDGLEKGFAIFDEKRPMGLGPFAYQFRSTKTIYLRYHPHYYSGRPFLDRIQIRFFDDEQQMVDALVNGEIDFAELPDVSTAQRINQLMGRKIIVFSVPRPEKKLYYMLFNLHKFPFTEPEVRRAILMGINRKQITRRILDKNGDMALTLFDEKSPHFAGGAFQDDYNPTQALRILTRAGWTLNRTTGILEKNGKPLSFKLYFSRKSILEENIVRSIKVYLGDLNINVQPVPLDQKQKQMAIQNGNFECLVDKYIYDPEHPFEAVEYFYFNILRGEFKNPNYRNRHIDRIFNISYRDDKIRKELIKRFQLYVRRDLPAIFLFFDRKIIVAVNSRFHNVRSVFRDEYTYYYRLNPISNWFVPKELQKYSF